MDGECSGCRAVIVSRWAGKHSPVRCQRPQQGEGAATWLSGAGGAAKQSALREECAWNVLAAPECEFGWSE